MTLIMAERNAFHTSSCTRRVGRQALDHPVPNQHRLAHCFDQRRVLACGNLLPSSIDLREREREEETSVSPYIKTSTHHTTLYEGLRCWVSHPMFALIPPLFPPLMGTSCDLVFRGLWGMCRYGAVSFLDMLCRDCFVQIDLRLGSTLTYPQHYRFCL